jgi:hypothetical protein
MTPNPPSCNHDRHADGVTPGSTETMQEGVDAYCRCRYPFYILKQQSYPFFGDLDNHDVAGNPLQLISCVTPQSQLGAW